MEQVKANILTLLNNIAKEQKLEKHDIILTAISSGGANYTSNLYTATITSDNKDDLELFIKVAAMGEKMRTGTKMYEIENFIYKELQAKFRELEDANGIAEEDRLKMPKFFGANTVFMEEIIVLENLVSKGFTSHDRMKSVGWEYAKSAVRELAKLHALAMALEHNNPENYAKLIAYFHIDMSQMEGMNVFLENSKQNALSVVREENFEKLKKFLESADIISFWDNSFKGVKREILMHADFRPSNLLHRKLDDGRIEVIPVDYQTMRGGGPITDLLYFIFTGTDKEFREQYYEKLIDHYYSELRAALVRLGLDPEKKYSRKDFDDELREKLPFGLGIAVFTLPIVTVEAESAPTVDENMDITSFSNINTGSLFPERLNGVVDDYVRWGAI